MGQWDNITKKHPDVLIKPHFSDDNNDTTQYMSTVDKAWDLGVNPTDAKTTIITKAIGNGQLGIGVKAPALDVATPLVLPPAIIVVLQVPAMYTVGGNVSTMALAIKDMFESHAKSVTGINIDYSLEAQEGITMHDGQTFQAPGKTKRAAQNPAFTFSEITGNLYWNIIRKWITDINNPDTYSIGANVHVAGGWTMSAYSMTIAVIQPDVTGRPERILDCSIICNMFPQGTGEYGIERTISTIQTRERSFTFSGIQQHNAYTKQLGKIIMEKLSMHKLDFDWAPPQRDVWTKSLVDTGLEFDSVTRREVYGRGEENAERNVPLKNVIATGNKRKSAVESNI